jgi:hypothetical protein
MPQPINTMLNLMQAAQATINGTFNLYHDLHYIYFLYNFIITFYNL